MESHQAHSEVRRQWREFNVQLSGKPEFDEAKYKARGAATELSRLRKISIAGFATGPSASSGTCGNTAPSSTWTAMKRGSTTSP